MSYDGAKAKKRWWRHRGRNHNLMERQSWMDGMVKEKGLGSGKGVGRKRGEQGWGFGKAWWIFTRMHSYDVYILWSEEEKQKRHTCWFSVALMTVLINFLLNQGKNKAIQNYFCFSAVMTRLENKRDHIENKQIPIKKRNKCQQLGSGWGKCIWTVLCIL